MVASIQIQQQGERFLDREAVADRYGIHPSNVKRYADLGRIPAPVFPFGPKGEMRWVASDIDAHIASFKRPAAQQQQGGAA